MFDLLLGLGVAVVALAAFYMGYGTGYAAGKLSKNTESKESK
jgi:hypothetical protein